VNGSDQAAALNQPGLADLLDVPFGQRVALLRAARGLSSLTLATAVGVSRVCIWKWEKGQTFPRSDKLQKLAAVLQTSISVLGAGSENQSGESHDLRLAQLNMAVTRARQIIAEAAGVPAGAVTIRIETEGLERLKTAAND
jgi:transcriptional regulator with XRE-family HTH domain